MNNAFDKYKQLLEHFVTLSDDEWDFFQSKIVLRNHKKGEIIHQVGDVCSDLLFVSSGIVRSFVIDPDGNDYTWAIAFNDENASVVNFYLVDYDSFINRTKSKISFEVIEDCQLLAMSHEALQQLYQNSKSGERFGRLMAEQAYSQAHKTILDQLTKSASMRYREFIEQTPHLLKKVPQYHIATFLGITPQSLSRIKKEITLCE